MNTTPKDLFDAGVHFGHQTRRWNPKSKPFVYGHRQGVTIVDLGKTHALLEKAYKFLVEHVADGKNVMLVGTKRQAQDIIREAASATGMPFAVNRWLGGTLTNYATIKRSIARYRKLQQMDTSGELSKRPRKEESKLRREMARMQRNFDGILEIDTIPAAMFVVDIQHEAIAVAEGRRCGIPVIGLVDTNSDPDAVTIPIPGNDDAVKSIRVIVDSIVAAIQEGLSQRDSRKAARAAEEKSVAAAAAARRQQQSAQADGVDLENGLIPAGVKGLDEEVDADGKPVAPKKRTARSAGPRKSSS